jgi:hypothetical protein
MCATLVETAKTLGRPTLESIEESGPVSRLQFGHRNGSVSSSLRYDKVQRLLVTWFQVGSVLHVLCAATFIISGRRRSCPCKSRLLIYPGH